LGRGGGGPPSRGQKIDKRRRPAKTGRHVDLVGRRPNEGGPLRRKGKFHAIDPNLKGRQGSKKGVGWNGPLEWEKTGGQMNEQHQPREKIPLSVARWENADRNLWKKGWEEAAPVVSTRKKAKRSVQESPWTEVGGRGSPRQTQGENEKKKGETKNRCRGLGKNRI